ncbi:hypothetical protein [Coleofasciculus sp. FACHB-T130]|uniref:hypothetical protein n=1 Tax=Cyanophyceae TaxID=3028117 RepID=UPI00168920C8|nr:hypothetical protein [Coleofasciculus sp. FACHB-T130]MBD1879767.1 hypothetical protein [Coleofasciculus sp. FACHB-T130]
MKVRSLLSFGVSLAILSAGSLFLASAAKAETKTAQSGNVRAESSYQEGEGSCQNSLSLKVIRNGQTVLQQPLSIENDACRLSNLYVRNLDKNREPEVIVDLFSGGVHCCVSSRIYQYNPMQKRYAYIKHEWGNGGYEFRDLDRDGIPEFYSRDDRFAYAFSSYAASRYPLQIWQHRQGKMIDVTRRYPKLVYSDTYQMWQDFIKAKNNDEAAKPALAAYLAGKYLLGQGQEGWRQVQQAYQGSERQKFFSELRSFLRKNGYIRS